MMLGTSPLYCHIFGRAVCDMFGIPVHVGGCYATIVPSGAGFAVQLDRGAPVNYERFEVVVGHQFFADINLASLGSAKLVFFPCYCLGEPSEKVSLAIVCRHLVPSLTPFDFDVFQGLVYIVVYHLSNSSGITLIIM